MRMILVIFAALIVAGGTGYYVVQGLRPPAPEEAAQIEMPRLRQVFVPSGEIAPGTILTPVLLARMDGASTHIPMQLPGSVLDCRVSRSDSGAERRGARLPSLGSEGAARGPMIARTGQRPLGMTGEALCLGTPARPLPLVISLRGRLRRRHENPLGAL